MTKKVRMLYCIALIILVCMPIARAASQHGIELTTCDRNTALLYRTETGWYIETLDQTRQNAAPLDFSDSHSAWDQNGSLAVVGPQNELYVLRDNITSPELLVDMPDEIRIGKMTWYDNGNQLGFVQFPPDEEIGEQVSLRFYDLALDTLLPFDYSIGTWFPSDWAPSLTGSSGRHLLAYTTVYGDWASQSSYTFDVNILMPSCLNNPQERCKEVAISSIQARTSSQQSANSGTPNNLAPTWDSGGQRLAFITGDSTPAIYTINLATLKLEHLVDLAYTPLTMEWSPCDTYIAFEDGGDIALLNTDTKQLYSFQPSFGHVVDEFTWVTLPDGDFLFAQ